MAALLARSLAGFTRNVGKHRPRLLCDSVSPFRNGAKLLEAAATAARGDSIRCYAKDKSKGDKKSKGAVKINEAEMAAVMDVDHLKKDLERVLERLRNDYVKNLSLRSAGSVEGLLVEFEGERWPLQELATIGRKNPQLLVVDVSALPQALPAILKALRESGMGLNPQQEGTTLFISLPKVTREHRELLAKNARLLFHKCKEAVRDVQNAHVRRLKRAQTPPTPPASSPQAAVSQAAVSQDQLFSVEKQILALAALATRDAEKLMEAKQKELLQE